MKSFSIHPQQTILPITHHDITTTTNPPSSSSSFPPVIATTTAFSSLLIRPSPSPTPPSSSLPDAPLGLPIQKPPASFSRLAPAAPQPILGLIPGLPPPFTFPNHYSIATGLFTPTTRIVDNHFLDPSPTATSSPDSTAPRLLARRSPSGPPPPAAASTPQRSSGWLPRCTTANDVAPRDSCQRYNKSCPSSSGCRPLLSYFDLPHAQIPSPDSCTLRSPTGKAIDSAPDDSDDHERRHRDCIGLLGQFDLWAGTRERVFDDVHYCIPRMGRSRNGRAYAEGSNISRKT
ncbi:uncharacterized protein A4U43_C06F10380 [Asparagus officinalis]|uniref:Uncharacterized protein n=1 Tax=Asparagus officinalis TaxID=4686 RepID=A0A5P1ELV0_ASPOF|nr:uncharacterized protein A4U43_C06F10380 [Asparagus officinalis]